MHSGELHHALAHFIQLANNRELIEFNRNGGKPMPKKMFVSFTSRNEDGRNPIDMALKVVAKACNFELVETPAEAELILIDSPPKALEYLKEHESAVIIIALDPFRRKDVEPGARSLEKAYAGRVHVRPLLDLEGEKNLVVCLMEGEFK